MSEVSVSGDPVLLPSAQLPRATFGRWIFFKGFIVKVWLAILLAACSPSLWAQLKWMPEDVPQVVFAGEGRKIQVTFSNPTDQTIEVQISTRLFQASSVTAVPLGALGPGATMEKAATARRPDQS